MKAVVYDEYRATPVLRDVPDPTCPPDGVIVSVRATGVCRSDWHAWQGHDPVPLPHIPGHELAGVVAETGTSVVRWEVGARVTVPFVCGCGRCDYCRSGAAQVCPNQTQPGFTGPGSFAERVVVHAADTNLVALPDALDFVTAASLGCRFATAFRAVTAQGRIEAGQWLAVHGCGGVGLSAVMIGAALGARVVAVDVVGAALDHALAVGAEVAINARDGSVVDAVINATGGGPHVSLDAIGSPDAAVASVQSLRRRGRHVQVGLLLAGDSTPPLPMDRVVAQELELYGSHGMAATDYPPMLNMIADGLLRPEQLLGRTIGLDQAPEALMGLDGPAAGAGMTVVVL